MKLTEMIALVVILLAGAYGIVNVSKFTKKQRRIMLCFSIVFELYTLYILFKIITI